MSSPVKPLPAEDLAHVFSLTRNLWAEAKGQVFFITGGTGFFGMWLLESFAHANDALGLDMKAVVLSRDPTAFAKKAPHLATRGDLEFVAGDVRTFTFPSGKFGYVIHAATDTARPPVGTDLPHIKDDIVAGTRRMLEFAGQAGTRKFLYVSSGAVYGAQPSELSHIEEDYKVQPQSLSLSTAYGLGKLDSEELCRDFAQQTGCECKIARCFAFVGPHLPLDGHFAIGNFIRDALAGGPIRIDGDGTPFRSYLYAADLAVWLWTMLFIAPTGRLYNVGSDAAMPIGEVAARVHAVVAPQVEVQIARIPSPGMSPSRYVPSVERAETELGLKSLISLDESLRRTAAWLQNGHQIISPVSD